MTADDTPTTLWQHWLRRAEAGRRRAAAQRKLHRQVDDLLGQARHDLRHARRSGTTALAVARARLTEFAASAITGSRRTRANQQEQAARDRQQRRSSVRGSGCNRAGRRR
jgi:hypothetical protein